MVLEGGFVISDIIFGCDDPTYNPSPVQELSLHLSFREAMQGDLIEHGLVYEEGQPHI